ncbi:LPPG:FO 2-phospho-L-lactate transferase [Litorivivens lipolytica]|uniref:LPPG:FO 2-phospho-L-lactate transferase n=1 Tax=Litorivivens lipolytica TaxID=1524264 RepID=A0A7W4W3Q1_9GAMM|nr:2-phospho-L-lactate transferase [Litorivivens lipolytica]MBB3046573.1 LPPG:FO 2-phospho-L-lactate transferase [Litorivivens lipolytica]
MSALTGKVVALTGGVGGAKLARGLIECLAPDQLLIVANTGDDFNHLGLSISPDLDSVMYALADLNDPQRGWGLAGESWQAMDALQQLGGADWFKLGDRDIATHLQRSVRLREGASLSQVTRELCAALGIQHRLVPMTNDRVSTMITTEQGELAFQEYFVREQCAPAVSAFRFDGIELAQPLPELMDWLAAPDLEAIIVCPSNPFVSVDPILQLRGVRAAIQAATAPVVAVSPIVGGLAVKGPAAKMMKELNMPATATAVAQWYGELLDGLMIDVVDRELVDTIETKTRVLPTLMSDLESKVDLAQAAIDFARQLD